MKIWVVGYKGMLGNALCLRLQEQKIPFIGTGKDIDITSLQAVSHFIDINKEITHIVNCAGYTQVDKAEQEQLLANSVNVTGPYHLALIANQHHIHLTHLSTDYVFAGKGKIPYQEDSICQPSSIYGMTKLEGEQKVLNALNRACIIRTSWLFGLNGKNFVSTMLDLMQKKETLRVVSDQIGCPTFCPDLADAIIALLNHEGIFHFSNSGSTSWYAFALTIAEQGLQLGYPLIIKSIQPITTAEYPAPAKRPAYSVLDTTKIERTLHYCPRPWQESLFDYLQQLQLTKSPL